MNSPASASSNRSPLKISPSLIARLLSSPLRIGIWSDDLIHWLYPSSSGQKHLEQPMLISSMNSTKQYEIIKFHVTNSKQHDMHVRIVVLYQNQFCTNSTAFYSPNEKAIICYSDQDVTFLGGSLQNGSMKQYSIQNQQSYCQESLQKDIMQGCLPMSWIGKGDIVSIFTLEAVLPAGTSGDGTIWTFYSPSEEEARKVKEEMIGPWD